ncbi:hypothetical protein [Halococcus saccharolyticus]|uniref:Uncharacterized protein n=1 Tax=Halococcus saccharolyticus DSM 5350 TaxID=1227455 RepID=M0MER1_9EURY|nr:hypothetical protein [Halococcus saccharolyticus]EMA43154.1 hypothetical protein C449_14287 [Halococcus saccharolyticus DSM 5350]
MSTPAASTGRLRRGWDYYRRYTKRRTGVHAAAAAALTAFGLLATVHRGFIAVAIASYLLPPIYLYLTGDEIAGDERTETRVDRGTRRSAVGDADADADADGTDGDGDADADGGDTDTDSDGPDTDTDSDGVDTDSDSDG